MNTHSFLHGITKANPLHHSLTPFTSEGNYRNASIACILRLAPPSWDSMGKTPPLPARFPSVDEVLEHMRAHDSMKGEGHEGGDHHDVGVEILFIKRAMRPGDQWGGHVAWPGGFINDKEDAITGVQREVMEELGVDLAADSNYTHLGAMAPTMFGPSHKGLHPHVYMKLNIEKPEFVLEEKEVDAVTWINAKHFLKCTNSSHLDTHTILAEDVISFSGWRKKLVMATARLLGMDKWHFPCVRIPPQKVHAYTDNHVENCEWVVWGLTFNTIRRLLRHANGGKEYLALDTPYRTENSIFNSFVAYFYKYYTKRHDESISAPNPDTDPNLHRKILVSSACGLAGVYGASAAAGVGIYALSTTMMANALI